MRHALILAGGRSTRLWPLARPKQFLPLAGDQSLLAATWDRLDGLVSRGQRWIVGGTENRGDCEAILGALGSQFIAEPEARNTAPAIGLACVHLRALDPEAVVVILPADHHVVGVEAFQKCLDLAFDHAEREDRIVTLGIRPSHGATGYGYLRLAEAPGPDGAALSAFVEKPDADKAKTMVAWGDHLWNAGIFVARVGRLLEEFRGQMPATFEALESIAGSLGTSEAEAVLQAQYPQCEATSIDYGIMEGARGLWCIPASCGWSDLGTWTGLSELWPLDGNNNAIHGDVQVQEGERNIVYVSGGPPVAVRGVDDLVIVSTADGILVIPKDRCEEVRHLVAERKDR